MFDTTARSIAEFRSLIDRSLEEMLRPGELNPAVQYAVFSGGKRMRPMLTLLAAQACGADASAAVPAACAVELLHTASLILDDMPCMDNAAERRGIPAVHVMFSEGMATLASLALLNRAYSILGLSAGLLGEAEACVAEMIEGQAVDLQGGLENPNRKTSSLMRLTFTAGAIACGASNADVQVLARCGEQVGEAYQMYDDFEDGDAGSETGADEMVAEAKAKLHRHFGHRATPLTAAIDAIARHCHSAGLVAA